MSARKNCTDCFARLMALRLSGHRLQKRVGRIDTNAIRQSSDLFTGYSQSFLFFNVLDLFLARFTLITTQHSESGDEKVGRGGSHYCWRQQHSGKGLQLLNVSYDQRVSCTSSTTKRLARALEAGNRRQRRDPPIARRFRVNRRLPLLTALKPMIK